MHDTVDTNQLRIQVIESKLRRHWIKGFMALGLPQTNEESSLKVSIWIHMCINELYTIQPFINVMTPYK